MSTNRNAHVTYQNPTTGLRTITLNKEATRIVTEWHASHGRDVFDVARRPGMRRQLRKGGRLAFKCGGGYAIFDADLLGGNGDGRAERAFNDETGFYFRY